MSELFIVYCASDGSNVAHRDKDCPLLAKAVYPPRDRQALLVPGHPDRVSFLRVSAGRVVRREARLCKRCGDG